MSVNKGHCYICSRLISKSAIKRHLEKHEYTAEDKEECYWIKVEAIKQPDYWKHDFWLYLEFNATSGLFALNDALRQIWFSQKGEHDFYRKNEKYTHLHDFEDDVPLKTFENDTILFYDFGTYPYHVSDTTLKITFLGKHYREISDTVFRVLARNEKPITNCDECNNEAKWLDKEFFSKSGAWYCDEHFYVRWGHPLRAVHNRPRIDNEKYQDNFKYDFSEIII